MAQLEAATQRETEQKAQQREQQQAQPASPPKPKTVGAYIGDDLRGNVEITADDQQYAFPELHAGRSSGQAGQMREAMRKAFGPG